MSYWCYYSWTDDGIDTLPYIVDAHMLILAYVLAKVNVENVLNMLF